MAELIEIRVGIVAPRRFYHGQLAGRRLITNGQRFQLREIKIPQKHRTQDVKQTRCHFLIYVDAHKPQCPFGLLSQCDLIASPSGQSEKLHEKSYLIQWGERWRRIKGIGWRLTSNQLLSSRGVITDIRYLMKKMKKQERRQWLARMATLPKKQKPSH